MTAASGGPGADGLALPRSVEELTPEWLTAALRGGGSVRGSGAVTRVGAERIGLGRGYVAELWRLRPTYQPPGAGPGSVIAKLPAARGLPRSWWSGYLNEWRFYRELAASVPLRTARYLGGAADEPAGLAVTLLEDLGAPPTDGATGSPSLAEQLVDQMAGVHAAFWEREPPDWLATDPEVIAGALGQYTRAGLPQLMRYAEGDPPIPAGLIAIAPRLPELVSAASLRLRRAPQTLIHGDLRPDNLLPVGGGGGVAVIDWQSVSWNAGVLDIAYFLGQSLEPGQRREHERALLARYLDGLAAAGVGAYEGEALWDDYRRGLVLSLFSPVGWSAAVRAAEELTDLAGHAGDSARAVVEHGIPLVRSLAHRNWRAVEETRALEVV